MKKLFYFEADRETKAAAITNKSKRWFVFLSDYLAKKKIERGLEPPESRDYVRCPIDKEFQRYTNTSSYI